MNGVHDMGGMHDMSPIQYEKNENLEAKRIRVEYSFFPGVIDVQHRLPKLDGVVLSQLGPSAQEALKAENHGAVAFLDVPPGSRGIRAGSELNQIVPVIDSPALCLPAPGNISPVFQACLDREIQSGSIRAGLATRYDLSKHFEQLVASAFQFGRLQVNRFGREPNDARTLVSLCPQL